MGPEIIMAMVAGGTVVPLGIAFAIYNARRKNIKEIEENVIVYESFNTVNEKVGNAAEFKSISEALKSTNDLISEDEKNAQKMDLQMNVLFPAIEEIISSIETFSDIELTEQSKEYLSELFSKLEKLSLTIIEANNELIKNRTMESIESSKTLKGDNHE